MSSALEIYTYGGGEALSSLFHGIVGIVGDDNYTTLVKLAGTVGLAWVLLVIAFKPNNYEQLTKWFVGYLLIFNALLVPKVTIQVKDYLNPGLQQNIIQNVPWGLGYFAHMASSIGNGVTELLEKNFFKQGDLKYQKYGTVMASTLVSRASQFRITNPDMASHIREFVQQCVFYDLLLGKYQIKDLFETNNLWHFVKSYASPARSFRYKNSIETCRQGSLLLEQDWRQELEDAKSIYGKRFFPNQKDAKAALVSALPLSYGYLTNISESAGALIRQNMMMNAIHDGLVANGAVTDSSAAIQGFAVSRAEQQQKTAYAITGQLAGRWLPIMKNVFEALFYGAFPFIFLIILLPSGLMVLKTYLMSLFWIQSWAPLYAILNLLMHIDAKSSSLAAASLGSSTALNLATASGIEQVNADTAILAGYLSMAIPFIAFGIVKGGAHTFTHLAGYIGGVSQASATQASEEATTGNISLANTSMGNHNFNNTNANKYDTNADIKTGLTSMQSASGASVTTTASGRQSISSNHAISNTGLGVSLAESVRASAMQQSEQYTQAAEQSAFETASSMSNAYRQVYELGKQQSQMESNGQQFSVGESAHINKELTDVRQLIDNFSSNNGLTFEQGASVLANASVSAGLPKGISEYISPVGFTVGGEISGLSNARQTEVFNSAKDYVESNNLSQKFDRLSRAVTDSSYQTGNEQTDRLVENVGSSLDKADTARESVSHNIMQAESYKEMASIAEDRALSFNSNANQEFIEWLSEKPGLGGVGQMSADDIEHILHHRPELARAYASEFVQEKTEAYIDQYANENGFSSNVDSESNHSFENSSQTLTSKHNQYVGNINGQASESDISFEREIDNSLQHDANRFIKNNDHAIQQSSSSFLKDSNERISNTQSTINDKKDHLVEEAAKNVVDTGKERYSQLKKVFD